jgi:prevent-host-death family protein
MTVRASEVTAFEAKTHLSELLRETERGRSFVIRRRGKAVARLVPCHEQGPSLTPRSIMAAFREIRTRARGRVKVRDLVQAGRRF